MDAVDWTWRVTAAVLGAVIGSFLNVVVYRLPRRQSVVWPGSRCPSCRNGVAWYDNVPVLSWAWLRGRCRRCGWRIPVRYPSVEFISLLVAVAIEWRFGPTLQAVWFFAFAALLIAITLIDWDHQIIPDPLSIGGTVLGWIGAVVCLDVGVWQSILGSIVGAGVILTIALLYKTLRKIDGMGGGDVKLMAMIGAYLGWQFVFPVLFVAAFFGSLYGLALVRSGNGDGKTAVAFGSFLAPAAILMLFLGERFLALYLGLARIH